MGPDLTNAMSYRGEGIGEAIARAFLMNGGNGMPNYELNETEINALVAYLKFVDKTGTYPPKVYDMTWYGMIQSGLIQILPWNWSYVLLIFGLILSIILMASNILCVPIESVCAVYSASSKDTPT